MAAELNSILFQYSPQITVEPELTAITIPIPPVFFESFNIADLLSNILVDGSLQVSNAVLKDISAIPGFPAFADLPLNFAAGTLTATETEFSFGWQKSSIELHFDITCTLSTTGAVITESLIAVF